MARSVVVGITNTSGVTDLGALAHGAAVLTGDPDQSPLAVVDLDAARDAPPELVSRACSEQSKPTVVTVGIATEPVSPSLAPLLEALTTTLAPAGPGHAWVPADTDALERISATVRTAPTAALTLANLLRMAPRGTVADHLQLESLAYSTLLAGSEFRAWRARTPTAPVPDDSRPVLLDRDGDILTITLNRPERHNAFGRAVRDGLIEGLELALADDSLSSVVLRGAGRSFCSGGDLAEFGTAADPAAAHLVRLGRSAGRLMHELGDRVRVEVHGACIGAGVEVPSFAAEVVARDDAFFQLPELAMGLIPGAGGTVSLTQRIGPWRTAFLALTGDRIGVGTALEWGLVDGRL